MALSKTVNKAISGFQSFSADEKKMLSQVKGPERAQMQAQLQMQKRQELVSFLSNIMKMKHDASMAIVNNTR